MDIQTMRSADFGSNHHLVRAILQVRFKRPCQKSAITSRREWSKLTDPTTQERCQIILTNRFTALDEINNIHEAAEMFAKVVDECTREIYPTVYRRTQSWSSEESLKLVHQRSQCKLTNMTRYRQLNEELRFHLKNERNVYWNNVTQEREDAKYRREYRYLYTTLRRLGGKVKQTSENIKKKPMVPPYALTVNVSITGRNTSRSSTIDQDQKATRWIHRVCKTSQSLSITKSLPSTR